MSEDNPVLKMYEAQAIAIEQQMEIVRLKKEREELIESFKRLGRIDQRNSGQSSSKNDEKEKIDELEQRDKDREAEIKALKMKNEELEERLRCLELEKEDESFLNIAKTNFLAIPQQPQSKNIDDVWTVVNGLTGQFVNMQDQIREISGQITLSQEKLEDISTKLRNSGNDIQPHHTDSKNLQNTENTILILGYYDECDCALVLSADRTKWIKTQLKLHNVSYRDRRVVYLNEEIYLFGEAYYTERLYNGLYKLDRNSLKWIKLADMNIARKDVTKSCLAFNGYIWVFGGMDEKRNWLKSVERYDPIKNKWILMPEMKYGRSSAAAVLWNNSIIISGFCYDGSKISRLNFSKIECFKDGCWTELPNLSSYLGSHSLVTYQNKLVQIGDDGKTFNNMYEIQPYELTRQSFPERSNTKWSPLPPLKHRSDFHTGIVLDHEIYAISGSHVEIFDQNWRDGPPLPYPMYSMSAVIIPQTLADHLCNYKQE